ncbi:MAG: chromosomal replication initiator protein DnaA, partial [Ruminococcus sp.]|nr:chromosomal replication initiator protein DnaA [Ruminococcus sp.]
MNLDDLFNAVLDDFQNDIESGKVTQTAFKLWISTTEPVKMNGNEIFLQTSSSFSAELIIENYKDDFEDKFSRLTGLPIKVTLTWPELPPREPEENTGKKKELEKTYKRAEYEYTFDTFIVGQSNKFAYAASRAVAEEPAT